MIVLLAADLTFSFTLLYTLELFFATVHGQDGSFCGGV